ncbi:hypothetical protein JOD44_002056 [Salimicrobium jeotgali]|nr:hypothetical protein [Salimicrobium jeotgali]
MLLIVTIVPLGLIILSEIINEFNVPLSPRGAGALITGLVAAIATYIAFDRLDAYHSQRYIESINTERREWLNNLRITCKDYYFLAENLYTNSNVMPSCEKRKIENQLHEKIIYLKLLTNPKEEHVKVLHKLTKEIYDNVKNKNKAEKENNCNNSSGDDNIKTLFNQLETTMQIILKTEWSIIKQETKKGEELNDEEKQNKMIKVICDTNNSLNNNEQIHSNLLSYLNGAHLNKDCDNK